MSPDFWGVLVGAVVGGIFTLAGGFGGSWWLGHREQKDAAQKERLDLIGAIMITEYELVENVAWLKGIVQHSGTGPPVPLSNVAYRSVQLLLARRLPPDLNTRVARAYAMIPVAQVNLRGAESGSLSADASKNLEDIKNDMEDARKELGRHRATLRAEVKG